MLLANYSVLNRNCDAMVGNAFTNPFDFYKATLFPRFYCGDSNVTGETNKSVFNNGYAVVSEGGSMWHLSPKAGGLACNMIYGTGTVSASLTMGKALAAALTGSGGISAANLALIVSLAAALTGSGTISAATLQAVAGLSAALSGSGSISAAALSLIVSLDADLTGSGSLAGNLKGKASMAADIVVTGTGLTTANVSDAVMNAIAETGPDGTFSYADIMRILASYAAGLASGGPGSPEIKAISDATRARITGTADASGNRTAVTLDGGE
jgi:hypothetical protein